MGKISSRGSNSGLAMVLREMSAERREPRVGVPRSVEKSTVSPSADLPPSSG